jgi:hypothetical protein
LTHDEAQWRSATADTTAGSPAAPSRRVRANAARHLRQDGAEHRYDAGQRRTHESQKRRGTMDKHELNFRLEEYEPTRPGFKTLALAIVVVLFALTIFNWPAIKAVIDALR